MAFLSYHYNIELKNKRIGVMCLDCGWIRVSFDVHDFRQCPCPNEAMVDGGTDYLRYGAMKMDRIQMVEVKPAPEPKKKAKKTKRK